MQTHEKATPLVIFGASNILSDLFDAALSVGLIPTKIVIHDPEEIGSRDLPLSHRLQQLASICPIPEVIQLPDFLPMSGEKYLLGPTTPTRRRLADLLEIRWGLRFHTLIHKTAYVSALASLEEGVYVGANSVIAPGTTLQRHVFVNRGVTIGHDNIIGAFSRIQPGANLGGLSVLGEGVTVGLGATLIERLRIGNDVIIAGGAVVLKDIPDAVMVAGVPATIRKQLSKS
jgi:sugar O-acyltransferase (sialic acid O-acetyltransferase NeuD family)